METKDGYELKINNYYFLENGQCVILNDFAKKADGTDVFMVTPFYEGETMTVSGDGGEHHEMSMEYECEGQETMVTSLFDTPPLEKLCSTYKKKLDEIQGLSLSISVLKNETDRLRTVKRKLLGLTKEIAEKTIKATDEAAIAKNDVDILNDRLTEKRQQLSELEDSITDLKSEDVSSMISKTELQRLNKRDFKLSCLESGGVDNWGFHDESLEDFRKRYPG